MNLLIELQTLENLIIPENLKKILNNSNFLIKNSIISNDRILLFIIIINISIFKQLYIIYECVQKNKNLQIIPFIYILILSKSEKYYKKLF